MYGGLHAHALVITLTLVSESCPRIIGGAYPRSKRKVLAGAGLSVRTSVGAHELNFSDLIAWSHRDNESQTGLGSGAVLKHA